MSFMSQFKSSDSQASLESLNLQVMGLEWYVVHQMTTSQSHLWLQIKTKLYQGNIELLNKYMVATIQFILQQICVIIFPIKPVVCLWIDSRGQGNIHPKKKT